MKTYEERLYAKIIKILGEEWFLIKEYQMFGHYWTYRNLSTGGIVFVDYDLGQIYTKESLFEHLKTYWRPVASEEREYLERMIAAGKIL